ncbi:MAG TPA: asparagine synthase-related protein [Pyrinomonadaceae bacterium]|jgi:asparagine synthase (glutamine-hydrolysing)
MSFVDALTGQLPGYRRRQHGLSATVTGWRIAYGNVRQMQEEGLWRDEGCAVLAGRWEACRSGRFIAVGDVWLTNRAELLAEVDGRSTGMDESASGKYDSAPTDLRIIALLWQAHGWRTPQLLAGAYAFCVWDSDRETLWLVRDRVGVETLYHTTEGSVRYAGARAADVVRGATRELDAVAVRDYLCCAFVPGERTMWRALREVRPGTILRLPDGETKTYWQVEERVAPEQMPLASSSARLRNTLEQVVRDCLPEGAPVGVYLSGGLDSSCVAALAARLHQEPVHSYSIHFGEECPNELEFSALVAAHCRTEHHVIEIKPQAMWELLPETMAHLDDPIGDPLTVPNLILGRAAKSTVNTILNGEGGDPCFGGPKNQPMLLTQLYRPSFAPTEHGQVHQDEQPLSTSIDPVASYLASFQKCATDLPRLLRSEVWESVQAEASVFADAFNSPGSYLNNLMFINTRFKGADHILTKVNNLTRAAGLLGRSPLFDDRIVELSLEIPPEHKLDGAQEKAVLKAAVADLLPARILERPKSGMMVPVQRWFRERWRRRAGALLLSRRARTRQFLNQDVVRDWLNYRGDVWARYGVKLWLLVSLELWLQTHTRE